MATYVYETIPKKSDEKPVRFEWQQSMKEAPLRVHPDTGMPVRRIISGGYGLIGGSSSEEPSGGNACGEGCCCG